MNDKRESMVRPVAVLMISQAAGKALLFVREMVVAALFGASTATDAYNVGLSTVSFFSVALTPLVEDTFIPIYVKYLQQDKVQAGELLSTVSGVLLTLLAAAAVVSFLAARPLVYLFAPGFDTTTFDQAVELVRILCLFLILLGITTFQKNILTAHKAFVSVGVTPVLGTLVVIAVLWAGASRLDINSLAWGMVAGAVLQLLIWGRRLWQMGLVVWPALHLSQGFKTLGRLSLIMLGARYLGSLISVVDRNMLSRLSEGSIASIGFARSIFMLPFQVVTLGITGAAVSLFSWSVAREDEDALRLDVNLALRLALFLLLPSTVGLILLRTPLVSLVYQRGAFDLSDTTATAQALFWFSFGLCPRAAVFIIARAFLARKDALSFLVIAIVQVIFHVLLNVLLIPILGHAGVALSDTLGVSIMMCAAVGILRWQLGPLGGRRIIVSLAKISFAALLMGVGLVCGLRWWPHHVTSFPLQALQIGTLMVLGGSIYLAISFWLRVEVLQTAWLSLSTRLWRSR